MWAQARRSGPTSCLGAGWRGLARATQRRDRGFAEPGSRTLHGAEHLLSLTRSGLSHPCEGEVAVCPPALPPSPGQPHARALILSAPCDLCQSGQREPGVPLHALKTARLQPAGARRGDGFSRGPVFLFLNSQRVPRTGGGRIRCVFLYMEHGLNMGEILDQSTKRPFHPCSSLSVVEDALKSSEAAQRRGSWVPEVWSRTAWVGTCASAFGQLCDFGQLSCVPVLLTPSVKRG